MQSGAFPLGESAIRGDGGSRTLGTVVHLSSKQARKAGMRVVSEESGRIELLTRRSPWFRIRTGHQPRFALCARGRNRTCCLRHVEATPFRLAPRAYRRTESDRLDRAYEARPPPRIAGVEPRRGLEPPKAAFVALLAFQSPGANRCDRCGIRTRVLWMKARRPRPL